MGARNFRPTNFSLSSPFPLSLSLSSCSRNPSEFFLPTFLLFLLRERGRSPRPSDYLEAPSNTFRMTEEMRHSLLLNVFRGSVSLPSPLRAITLSARETLSPVRRLPELLKKVFQSVRRDVALESRGC